MSTTHNRIQSETVIVSEADGVAAHRCLAHAGDYPANSTVAIYGITRTEADDDEAVTIDVLGRIEVQASAAIAVGAQVMAGADGRVATQTGNNFVVGRCVKAAAAANDICEIVRGI